MGFCLLSAGCYYLSLVGVRWFVLFVACCLSLVDVRCLLPFVGVACCVLFACCCCSYFVVRRSKFVV